MQRLGLQNYKSQSSQRAWSRATTPPPLTPLAPTFGTSGSTRLTPRRENTFFPSGSFVIASMHGYVVEVTTTSRWGGLSGKNASMALLLAIVRVMMVSLIPGGLALWFYKSKKIQGALK